MAALYYPTNKIYMPANEVIEILSAYDTFQNNYKLVKLPKNNYIIYLEFSDKILFEMLTVIDAYLLSQPKINDMIPDFNNLTNKNDVLELIPKNLFKIEELDDFWNFLTGEPQEVSLISYDYGELFVHCYKKIITWGEYDLPYIS